MPKFTRTPEHATVAAFGLQYLKHKAATTSAAGRKRFFGLRKSAK